MVAAPVHPVPPRQGAAVEWWMYQVCRQLDGFEPHILCIAADELPDEEENMGVRYHRIRLGRLYKRLFQKITRLDPLSYAHRVARRLDALRPVIVHVHNAPALFAEIRRRMRWQGARFVLHMQNEMPVAALRNDELLVADSEYLRSWYAARLPGADTAVVTNGVDIGTYQPAWSAAIETASLKKIYEVPTDRKTILYVGRVSPEKGPLDLVHAFRELLNRRQDVFLLLVGEMRTGNDRRGEYGRKIQEACAALPGACRHVNVVNPADMHKIYLLSDLVVVPSRFEEPFGMVAIEAMAAGVPVLAARKGGLKEFVLPGQTGFLIENTEDPVTFARQMDALLRQPDELDRIRRQARRYVEQHHSWDVVTRQTEARYRRLLAPSQTPSVSVTHA